MDNVTELYQTAAGTVVGKDHIHSKKNNHDAYCVEHIYNTIIAIVCDGCGSGKHSEVGAKIGARLLAEAIKRTYQQRRSATLFSKDTQAATFLERVRQDVLAQLRVMINQMGGSFTQAINDYFLFTVIGVIITQADCLVFSLGDGLIAVNGDVLQLGPFPGNKPPYLAYGLVDTSLNEANFQFEINMRLEAQEVKSLAIGTDGALDLLEIEDQNIPGKDEQVGPLSQFWVEDKFFKNPDMVRRRLAQINRQVHKVDYQEKKVDRNNGLLGDDTTLVVIRRTPDNVEENEKEEVKPTLSFELEKSNEMADTSRRFPWKRT